MKNQKFYLIITKLSLGLISLLIVSLLLISSPVYGKADPLKNDFTLVWGGPEDEKVYAMEIFSDDIVYVAGDIGTWDPHVGGGSWHTSVGFFLTRLNVSKLRSGNPFPEWLFNWERTDAIGIFGDMIIDSSENIYVAGTVHNDIFLMRFNNAGILDWNITWGIGGVDSTYGFNSQHPDGKCLIMDSANNVYIAGRSGEDVVLLKYNNFGEYQWNRTWNILPAFGGYDPSDDYCEDIKIDSNDNIYIAVAAEGSYWSDHFAILKCNTDGIIQWNTTIFKPFHYPSAGILKDSNGLFFYATTYLTKFGLNTGTHLWNNSIWAGPLIKMDFDSLGNLMILTADCRINTFTSDGIIQVNFTSLDYYGDSIESTDFSIDSEGNIFILGYISSSRDAVCMLKINPSGENQYIYSWGSPEDERYDDFPSKIFVDSSDNIYVSGCTLGFGGSGDLNLFFAAFSQTVSSTSTVPFSLTFVVLTTMCTCVILLIRKKRKLT